MKLDEIDRLLLPQFFPADWLNEIPNIIHSDFPSQIRIGYVSRKGGAYSYLRQAQFEVLQVDLEELHSIALKNLTVLPSARLRIAQLPEGAEGYIESDDNFAAVRILLPEVRAHFAADLGREFLGVLPHRDDCFCWSQTQTNERQAQHIVNARSDYDEDDYKLSPDVFLFSESGIFLRHKI